MYQKIFLIFFLLIFLSECSKKEELSNNPPDEKESYKIYNEGLNAMREGDFFYAAKKFSEA